MYIVMGKEWVTDVDSGKLGFPKRRRVEYEEEQPEAITTVKEEETQPTLVYPEPPRLTPPLSRALKSPRIASNDTLLRFPEFPPVVLESAIMDLNGETPEGELELKLKLNLEQEEEEESIPCEVACAESRTPQQECDSFLL